MLDLQIINNQTEYRIPNLYLEKSAIKIIKILIKKKIVNASDSTKSLNLVFVNPSEMRTLNGKFRNKKKVTDVLSFNSLDPFLIGELIFCPKVIVDNANLNKWAQKYEYLYMLIHGVLHLLGYDHETDKDSKVMFKLQDQIFNDISDGPKVSD